MNKEKINDFVDVWAQVVGLKDITYINIIKNDIVKRCTMYEKEKPFISTKEDDCDAYIIKPVNGRYSFDDFLLNRLMLGLREIDFTEAVNGTGGEYMAELKSLDINIPTLNDIINEKSSRHLELKDRNVQIIIKTIEHELGHCFKTSFTNGYKTSILMKREQDDMYEELICALQKYKNEKYANQIKTIQELDSKEESSTIKTGVNNANSNYMQDARMCWIDELLNETEAMELANCTERHEIWPLQDENCKNSSSKNYVNVYNYISGYATFTGYGKILKSLLGKEGTFKAEYMSSASDIFKQFDQEYADIAKEIFEIDPENIPPTKCIFISFDYLKRKKIFDEEVMLQLDNFFARCYERKVEKSISENNGTLNQESREEILKEIEQFQLRLTTNDDLQKREQLAHNIIFNNIKTRINELSRKSNQPEIAEDTEAKQYSQQSEKANSSKMKFAEGFIRAYNDTEEEYQYEERAKYDLNDIDRVKEIIKTQGKNGILMSDLTGKLIEESEDGDFKVEYSQKQVSSMARLLKVAQLLTESKRLNPEGINYLEEFTNIPYIESTLNQMKENFKDKDSYMCELRLRAKTNRLNGTISSYPPTPAEIKANENQELQQNEKYAQKAEKFLDSQKNREKLSIDSVKKSLENSKIKMGEIQATQQEIAERNEYRRLKLQEHRGLSLEEQARYDMLDKKYNKNVLKEKDEQ